MLRKIFAACAVLAVLLAMPARAYTLSYDVAQLNADFEKARRDGGGMPRFAKDIQKYMNDMSLSVEGVQLAVGAKASSGGCTLNWNAEFEGIATLDPASRIEFMINSLKQPIVASLDVSGRLDGHGKMRGGAGFRVFGKCLRYASMQYAADIDADFKLWLALVVELNPVYDAVNRRITLTPNARLEGQVRNVDVSINNSSGYIATPFFFLPIMGPVSSIFDALLTDLANNKLDAQGRYSAWLTAQNAAINQTMYNKGFTSVVLSIPPKTADEATKLGLMFMTEAALSYPVPWQYLELNNNDLMFAALTNDKQMARTILAGTAACTASNALRSNMPRLPIYQKVGAACQVAAVNETSSGTFYSDSACTNSNIQLRSYVDICDEHFKTSIMGDGASWGATAVGAQTGWTYSYASQFNIGFDNVSSQHVPFMKRVAFKKISPVYERKSVLVYNKEAFKAAMAQCNTRWRFLAPAGGQVAYCTETVLPAKFDQVMLVESTLFDSDKYAADVNQCTTDLSAAYLANPGAYGNKYGGVGYNGYGQRYLTQTQIDAIKADCTTQTSARADYATRYAKVVPPVGTQAFDPAAYNAYVSYCTSAGPVPQQARSPYTYKGQSLSCWPLVANTLSIWLNDVNKPIVRGNGSCTLEMRVYKKDPNATNLKPLIMFHGGSWNRRSSTFAALEPMISYYTDRNFVVFAPFYRLAESVDGNTECNGSYSKDIAQDSLDAFNWVKTNGATHGALSGARPRLWGQSAGAYLVGYIVGKTGTADVEKAMMLYPPTDPISYAEGYKTRWQAAQAAGTAVKRSLGDDALEGFMDAKLDWYVSTDTTLKNKYIAAGNGYSLVDLMRSGSHAPVYLVHGNADDLVPVQQSISLCNALGGAAGSTGGTYSCGASGSQLAVVNGASHMLDLCIDNLICPASDKVAASQALQNAKNWFIQ